MAQSIGLSSATAVKAVIAEVFLGPPLPQQNLGTVTLRPHQASAVNRLRSAIGAFGGALLCDEVGMGKTFVAAAIAKDYHSPLIVAPASLRTMWHESMGRTGLNAEFVSFECLSRQPVHITASDFVVVDEAHHARNSLTNRYASLARLTRDNPVLLMSATPIHNRGKDLIALLSLFLGERARFLTAEEKSRCIIRRERHSLGNESGFPVTAPMICDELPDDPSVIDHLLAIPSPVPARDGSPEGHLFVRGMVHQWASSESALFQAIRRRRARAHALIASLEAGVLPTASELATWVYDEGTLQLGFAELLSGSIAEPAGLLLSAREHVNGLQAFLRMHSPGVIDAARVAAVSAIRSRHPDSRIVAFAQYGETIKALYRRLAPRGRVAMLTAEGARISSGRIAREEVVSQFQPQNSEAAAGARVDLLLSTDLLSEGVNLQGAQVVVHLDLPWTAARLEQRTGRVARIGSPHRTVYAYTIRPPASARQYLESEQIISTKWMASNSAIGSSTSDPFPPAPDYHKPRNIPAQTERLRGLLERWRGKDLTIPNGPDLLVASAESSTTGFIALLRSSDSTTIVCSTTSGIATDLDSLIEQCSLADGPHITTQIGAARAALRMIDEWIETGRAAEIAGLGSTSELVFRPRILDRIEAAVRSAAPHQRAARTRLAVAARAGATRWLGAAAEQELESLERSDLPADQWLQAVADFSISAPRLECETTPTRVIALLLLTPTPPASECARG